MTGTGGGAGGAGAVAIGLVALAAYGCGETANEPAPRLHVLPKPDMHSVKLGMTEANIQRLLGKPDDVETLPRAPGTQWRFIYPDGHAEVFFNAAHRVTYVADCPREACSVIVAAEH